MTFYLHKANGKFADGGFWSFGLTTSGSISESAAETAWAAAVVAFFTDTNVATYYSTGAELLQTSTSTASATFRQTTKTATSHTTVGTSTGNQLPTVLGLVVSLYTGNATRYGRGRMFLPAPTTTVLDTAPQDGMLTATVGGHIGTAVATWFNSLATAGLTPVLYTRRATRSGIPADTTSQILTRKVQGKLHVQKRRSDKIIAATYAA